MNLGTEDPTRHRLKELLSEAQSDACIGSRIEVISRQLLGRPYKTNPLAGSADTAEVFTTSLDGFDCVTYIETVLALARASRIDDFAGWLRKIRYQDGRVQWQRRNHYMALWIRNNARQGIITQVSVPALPTVSRERVLNIVPGIAARRISVRSVPKRAVPLLEPHLQTGDLIFFGSTRRNLDVFHAGIIVRDCDQLRLRHASRSHGRVLEEDLGEFLTDNRMAGVIVVRPLETAAGK
jgi:hypothetical protein